MKLKLTTAAMLLSAGIMASCSETNKEVDSAEDVRELATPDTAVLFDETNAMTALAADEEEFKEVNFDAPKIEDAELMNAGVDVRGDDKYQIYSVGEDIMFDTDKAQIRSSGEEKLQQIVKKIKDRDRESTIRVYGFTDARASDAYNKELGKERAKAVENWLINNSGLDMNRMKVVSMGERMPEATNETAQGRQQNRRVEIVVVNK
ncbi:OmpA family protein [Pontibacter sp. CAU 1760]